MNYNNLCSNCILPDTTPYIKFDENGVCNYCKTYEKMSAKGEEALIEVLNKHRGKNKKYDCMIGISGGRDSIYTLCKLVHDYDMRVLAFNDCTSFTSKQAQVNIQNAVELLQVDCIHGNFPVEAHKNASRKAIKAWIHHPSSSMIPIMCVICKSVLPRILNTARENDISLVVFGSNPLETASYKKKGLGGARNYGNISNLPNILIKSMKELVANPYYLTHCSWISVIKAYLMAGHNTPYIKWRFKDISVIRYFDYLKWNEREVEETISKNLKWQKSPEVASSWRFDCRLDYIKRIMYASTIGVTELQDLFSKMVREGMMTRDEALERIKQEQGIPKVVAHDVLNGIGLTLSDLTFELDQDLLV